MPSPETTKFLPEIMAERIRRAYLLGFEHGTSAAAEYVESIGDYGCQNTSYAIRILEPNALIVEDACNAR